MRNNRRVNVRRKQSGNEPEPPAVELVADWPPADEESPAPPAPAEEEASKLEAVEEVSLWPPPPPVDETAAKRTQNSDRRGRTAVQGPRQRALAAEAAWRMPIRGTNNSDIERACVRDSTQADTNAADSPHSDSRLTRKHVHEPLGIGPVEHELNLAVGQVAVEHGKLV